LRKWKLTIARNETKTGKEYYRRFRMTLKAQWNAKNTITKIGRLAVQVLRYSFDINNCG
jgi:hypothetical protein